MTSTINAEASRRSARRVPSARPRAGTGSGAVPTPEKPGPATVFGRALARLDTPSTSYYVIVGATAALVLIGLVMVLSASMITSYKDDGSAFAVFADQAKYAALGLVVALVAARISPRWWRRLAVPSLAVALVLQMLVFVPGLGVETGGNRNWLRLPAGLSMQPSELTKIGLVLVGALVLTNKRHRLGQLRHVLIPFLVPVAAVTLLLVLAGRDLGTALVLLGIVAAVLWVAGVPARLFLATVLTGAVAAVVLVMSSPNRMGRITNWLSAECASDPDGACGQSVHGLYALADGGWWGVGLGASKEKWAWLPEPHNDFIFAIIGEELGLPGTLVVLGIFAALATACRRLIVRTDDQFVRIVTGGVLGWILLQATINIGAVIGLLPVVGVPLPFVSSGGSALVTTMLAMGILVSFARHEPGAREALANRPGVVRRSLAVLPRPWRGRRHRWLR